jgi:hypothetical protein
MYERVPPPRKHGALVAIPVAFMVVVVVVDVLAPPHVHLGTLLIAAPAITASFSGPWTTGMVAALAVLGQAIIALRPDADGLFSGSHLVQIGALFLVGAILVVFCVLRQRRSRELTQVRYVAEMVQRGVLWPLLPARVLLDQASDRA